MVGGPVSTAIQDALIGILVELIAARIKERLDRRSFDEAMRNLGPRIAQEEERALDADNAARRESRGSLDAGLATRYFNVRIRVHSLTQIMVMGVSSTSTTSSPTPELEDVTISPNNINTASEVVTRALPMPGGGHPIYRLENSQVLTYSEPADNAR